MREPYAKQANGSRVLEGLLKRLALLRIEMPKEDAARAFGIGQTTFTDFPTTAELKSMQSERKAAYAKAEEEAILLTQLAYSKGNTVEPATHFPPGGNYGGFVYSVEEIALKVPRNACLAEARA